MKKNKQESEPMTWTWDGKVWKRTDVVKRIRQLEEEIDELNKDSRWLWRGFALTAFLSGFGVGEWIRRLLGW